MDRLAIAIEDTKRYEANHPGCKSILVGANSPAFGRNV